MKRIYRLRRPEQFQRVRRAGRSWESPLFVLQAVANRRRTTRCGFVVSKRIGGAVERNRAKRRMREAVRLCYPQLVPGWDLVFVIRTPAVTTVPFPELQAAVEDVLRRADVLRDQPTSI